MANPSATFAEMTESKTFTFCCDDVNEGGFSFGCDCCFSVVYYESVTYATDLACPVFFIGGIFWEGDDCLDCAPDYIVEYTIWSLIWEMNDANPNFRSDIVGGGSPVNGYLFEVFTPGKCRNSIDGEICAETGGCCSRIIEMGLLESNKDEHGTGMIMSDFSCPPPEECEESCSEFPYDGRPICDMPCGATEWETGALEVEIPDCPGCIITINFRYRTSEDPDCPEGTFNDYEIQSIDNMDLSACSGCSSTMTEQDIWAYSLTKIIEEGPINLPDPDECEENWRIAHASCWRTYGNGTYAPCEISGCCWALFKVCNGEFGITITKLQTHSVVDICEEDPSYVCVYVCDIDPPAQSQMSVATHKSIIRKTWTAPNPAEDMLTLYYESEQFGALSLEIFNARGEIVFSSEINKTKKGIEIPLNISGFISGAYYYRIKNSASVSSGRFLVK